MIMGKALASAYACEMCSSSCARLSTGWRSELQQAEAELAGTLAHGQHQMHLC